MIEYKNSVDGISRSQVQGFFVGWPHPPSPEVHLTLLRQSDVVVLALDTETGVVAGFITAITDKVLSAYIPLLEVLPSYQHQQIGTTLLKRMLEQLHGYYMVDLLCDVELQPFYEQFGMQRATGMCLRHLNSQSGMTKNTLPM